ncbi:hypothetical protein [Streptomyces virginiae]|uniref:hypothetical protein n=1 Tax=Streptomyces virginiae TaxID=1961 RepID=UPI0036668902
MAHRTDLRQADEALRRARTDLPVAAQVLHAVADTLSTTAPGQPLTEDTLRLAFTQAGYLVLAQYPRAVQDTATDRAIAALPNSDDLAPGITAGEYALHVRRAAGSLT